MNMDISVDSVIPTIVEAMLPRFTQDKALYIKVDYRVTNYCDDGEEICESDDLDLLFYRNSNYTRVFYRKCGKQYGIHNRAVWQMTCYHDSCWRTDGFSEMGRDANNMRTTVREKAEDAFAKLSEYCSIRELKLLDVGEINYSYDDRNAGKVPVSVMVDEKLVIQPEAK